MSGLSAGQVTAFFDRVASDWDEMRLVYYDEAVIEHMATVAELDASMTEPEPASSPPGSPAA